MGNIKERNYRYDSVRGICMYLIVLQHFILKGGYTFTDNVGNLIYVGIDIFVMQTFFFLSGMFSKNPEKGRDKLFGSLLWPVIIVGIFFWPAVIYYLGYEEALKLFMSGRLPYAMWFLVALFVYRYLQKYYVNIRHLFAFALVIYLVAGIFEPMSTTGFAIGRIFSFFISFVMGYLMTMEKVDEKFSLKVWQTIILGVILIVITYLTITYLPESFAKATRMSGSYQKVGLTIIQGIVVRSGLLVISTGWMIFLYNLFTGRKGIWAHIGMNTMPVYIFHLGFSALFLAKGFTFGLFSFEGHEVIYVATAVIISMILTLLLSTKPAEKAYKLLMEGTYNVAVKAMKKIKRMPKHP